MKILFLCRLFYPHIGGVERHVFELSKLLVKEGHDITIITETIDKADKQDIPTHLKNDLKKIKIYHIPVGYDNWFKKFRIWRWMWNNKDLFNKADIIHCHDVFFWYMPFAIINPMKNVYTTFHGYETRFPPRRRAILIRKISEYMSNKTISVGEYIRKWYMAKPNYITYGGVNIEKITSKYYSKRKLRILFVGRIEEDNGVYVYNEVLNILSRNKIEFEFQAIGEGTLRKLFEKWGDVTSTFDTASIIAQSDVVFASSYLSILEAFSHKKPVFSIYQNELKKDYLLMTPFKEWIVAEHDPTKLTHGILKYINDTKGYQPKIESAYSWAQKQTWDNLARMYKDLWMKR